ncbi:Schwannomin interacting protein 1 C-terminal domain-containing protein [Caenorhabditis elegans]|uniref:Schwannomin interacting protein 1 C-terminal domain-containing protein n=1 Tax=Caenorhabditis elegans TaxID=6239 RepID=Q20079_CAEEL|nr:Schwannomin interacting protein 1 C-terminal domain-containing protein [Caenorhabditis elegans]CCD70613.2 Schwannomin interacting protein 1 C-terminal domain-containing protein [Caenorhabditis elegans]|eukprot:NP_001338799.1 Uncharacterized protein CELE_F35H12.1 [Caenorhabditis elegans]
MDHTETTTSNNIGYNSSSESFAVRFMQTPSAVLKITNGEMTEDNNNMLHGINGVDLLDLQSTDNDDQYSNSSSLESRNSLTNHQGSQDGDGESGSTSCSEDSFEMSSTCSVREELYEEEKRRLIERNEVTSRRSDFSKESSYESQFRPPASQIQQHSELDSDLQNDFMRKIRQSVANQIEHIDTGLPQLDFVKLEQQLTTAAKEREDVEKRMTFDNISERKECNDSWRRYPSFQHQKKTNSVLRLPPSKNLQVCFMNELSETDTENGEDSEDSDMEHMYVRKSKSVPNFKNATSPDVLDSRSLQELHEKLERNLTLNDNERCKMLKHEAHRVMKIAEEKASTALAEYRRGRSKASEVPRQARQYLSKTKLPDIQIIHQQIEEAICRKNMELVGLLLERDNLHMEHDSLRVDIDDYTQQKSPLILLDMKRLLQLQKGLESNSLGTKKFC